jgi:TolB-like protein/Tfp pilus assembly protein PilF
MNLLWQDTIVEDANLTQNIFLLRKMFAEDGNRRKYIETIPRRGYRFIAEVQVTSSAVSLKKTDAVPGAKIIEKHTIARIITEEEIEDRKLLASGAASLWQKRKLHIAVLLVVLPAGAVALFFYFRPSSQSEIKTLAVLPLKSLDANIDDQSLGLKLADALILRLGRLQQIVVRPTRAVQSYEGKTLDPLVAGREQQVDAVLDGSFQRDGERLRVRVRLLRVTDGRQLWAGTFDERGSDPFYLQDALAEQTAQAIVPRLAGAERELVTRHDTENIEASRLYTEGRTYWNRRNLESLKNSIFFFEQAIKLDPNYARAYAGLADSYITLSDYDGLPPGEAYPKAKEAALRALEIDDTLAEAHTSLAMIKASYEWDWAGAEQSFRQAIELNPNYATARQWYGEYLAGMGRHQDALAEIRRAQALDPLSLIVRSVEAWVCYYAREYDQMIAQCRRVIEMDATFGEAYAYLGLAYEQKGMFREAMDAYQKYSTLTGYNTPKATRLRASAIADRRDYWRKMVELAQPPTGSEFDAAQAWSQLGETDKALDSLEKVHANRDYHILYLKVHPNLDPLRQAPRFQDLLRRVGLAD